MFKVHKGVAPVLFNETLPLNEQNKCSVSVFFISLVKSASLLRTVEQELSKRHENVSSKEAD